MVTVAEAHRTLRLHFPLPKRSRFARQYCHCGARMPCREREEALKTLANNR